ncbi:MAG: FG-GAP repeat domain-containing protein [Desulfomonilaceae bacterium]
MSFGLNRPHCISLLVLTLTFFLVIPNHALTQAPGDDSHSKSLLILPFRFNSEVNISELVSFIDHANKTVKQTIESLGSDYQIKTEKDLKAEPAEAVSNMDDNQAIEIARKNDVDLAIFGFLTVEDGQYRFRGYMWAKSSDRYVVTTDIRVENIHALPGILQTFLAASARRLHGTAKLPFYRGDNQTSGAFQQTGRPSALVSIPKNTGPWRSPEMPLAISSIDIGDLDGDGKNETVFVDDSGITISRFESGGLRPLTRYSQLPAIYISAEAQDLDGDGIAELILCYQLPQGLESCVMSYKNMSLTVLKRFPNIVLKSNVEPSLGDKPVLLGQKVDTDEIFSGNMIYYQMRKGLPEEVGSIRLPAGTFLLSYASGFIGAKKEFLRLILSQDQRLMAFDAENRLLAIKQDRIYGINKRLRIATKSAFKNVAFPGRILISRSSGDGFNELLLVRQVDSACLVEALGWEGDKFVDKWKTVTSQGIIADFLIRDFKNEGSDSLVLIQVNPLLFPNLTGFKSVVFAYDILP